MLVSLFASWVAYVALTGSVSINNPLPASVAPSAMHAAASIQCVTAGSRYAIATRVQGVPATFGTENQRAVLSRVRTRVRAGRCVQVPMQAYVFVPGVGTVVVSVASDGKTTVARVPAHMSALNFTQADRSLAFSHIRAAKRFSRLSNNAVFEGI